MSDTTTLPFPSLDEILQAFGVVAANPEDAAGEDLVRLLKEWQAYFQKLGYRADINVDKLRLLLVALTTVLRQPNRTAELKLIEAACENPLYGLMLVFAALPGTAARQAGRWLTMMLDPNSAGKTRTFPPPAPGTKYLVLSDIHRDAHSDDRGRFQSGSIDHFKRNTGLYQRILDWADDGEYVVLEGGDCEELWFVRSIADYPRKSDRSMDIAAKLREIIESHPGVYAKLRDMHTRGRYFRIYGNHDSFLKPDGADDSVFQVLKAEMEKHGAPPFEIWDSFVVPGVKTMREHAAGAVALDALRLYREQISGKEFADRFLFGRLGLDSNDYTQKSRLLITHGHQFDFWNSPHNEILGMLIANTVGMFVDRNMDPFLDVGGIALEGNPLLEFDDIFARLPVFDSWPAGNAAVAFAHQVKHMPNGQRVLNDNIMYWESVPAFWGTFGMPLDYDDGHGNVVTPRESRAELHLASPQVTKEGIIEYLRRHHFHQICIGHTHTPHSQPAFTLANIGNLVPPLKLPTAIIQALLPSFMEPQFKSGYFNSGTAGWMEGVVWGIEIDESGQARLVFWTENSIGPEYMDWELQPFPPEHKEGLREGFRRALDAPVDEMEQHWKAIKARMEKRLLDFNVPPEALKKALIQALVMPIEAMAVAFVEEKKELIREWVLEEVSGLRKSVDKLEKQLEQLRSYSFDVLLSAKRRALQGFKDLTDIEVITVKAPVTPRDRARLQQFKQVLMGMGLSEEQALHYAGLGMAVFDQFPRNLPFFTSMGQPQNPEARLQNSRSPVLQALLATLWMYPPAGQAVEADGVRIESRFMLDATHVRLAVTLSQATGDTGTGVA